MSGGAQILNMNETGAQGLPLNSYWKKTYTQADFPVTAIPVIGRMFTFGVNVTTAFAGTANPLRISPGQFHCFGTKADYTAYDFMPGISLRTAGSRIYYPQGVSGAVGADNNAPTTTSQIWLSQEVEASLSGSSSGGTFSVTFEVVCDQSALNTNGKLQTSGVFSQGTTAVAPLNYYTPGNEGPAVSTADYYHTHACQFMRPIDLDAFGTKGAAVKAANGDNRYAWIWSGEHPEGGAGVWRDSWKFYIGFSNDPGIFPTVALTSLPTFNQFTGNAGTPGANGYTVGADFSPTTLMYNPDDPTNPFWLFCQGTVSSAYIGTQGLVLKSSTLFDWTLAAWGPKNIDGAPGVGTPLTSYQLVERNGTGDWVSHGIVGDVGWIGFGKWTSTDGLTWTYPNSTAYNRGSYPALNFSISGTTLTSASPTFIPSDAGKGIVVGDIDGTALERSYTIATYVNSTTVTLSANPSLSFSNRAANVQYGPIYVTTAHAPDGTGGVNRFNTSGLATLPVTLAGQRYWAVTEDARHDFQATDDGMWVTMAAVDDDFNISQFRPGIHVSSQYTGYFPGPTYLYTLGQYEEDGILHLYSQTGNPGPHTSTPMPYVGASVLGSISGTTLTVASLVGAGNITLGAYVFYSSSLSLGYITAFGTGTGGTGTYTITNPGSVSASAGSSIDINGGRYGDSSSGSGGGLNEQFVDYHTITLDFATAAQAAPFGVAASCSSNTVTISWKTHVTGYDPWGISYNVYRGTTAGTQATLVGNSTSTSITDTPTPGSVYYYRVVKKSLGIEYPTKYRIVSTYVG